MDLNKIAGVNVWPDRTPDRPHGNVNLAILRASQDSFRRYVLVYRADPPRSLGVTGTVTTGSGEATAYLEPRVDTLAISPQLKVSNCDVRVRRASKESNVQPAD